MTIDKSHTNPETPRGNDKPGGGSQKAGNQQGRKIPGDRGVDLPKPPQESPV